MLTRAQVNKHSGFSMVEVMIVLAIVGVLFALAIPNVTRILDSNHATDQSHNFISAVSLAISQASKNDVATSICAKEKTTDTCVSYTTSPSTDTWRYGWLLFTDTNNTGTYNPGDGDSLIKTQINGTNKVNIDAPASTITVSSSGVISRGQGSFHFSPQDCVNSGHKITVLSNGQVTVKGGVCP